MSTAATGPDADPWTHGLLEIEIMSYYTVHPLCQDVSTQARSRLSSEHRLGRGQIAYRL